MYFVDTGDKHYVANLREKFVLVPTVYSGSPGENDS
jgi:hypothetical protein